MYIGRFAPSPTGPLHFGSLLAAIASYLDARAQQGQWLLRIEDLDPPREDRDAKQNFPRVLDAFGLTWDGSIRYQSERQAAYQEVLAQLRQQKLSYPCSCSRKQVAARQAKIYDRYCLTHPTSGECAERFFCDQNAPSWSDRIQGEQAEGSCVEDYVIYRKDKLWAYSLAVVVDDADQGISHIVRGSDLLPETAKQILLQSALGYAGVHYAHIPIATSAEGQKLSKQNLAPALNLDSRRELLLHAYQFLGLPTEQDLLDCTVEQLLSWAVKHWDIGQVPKCLAQPEAL